MGAGKTHCVNPCTQALLAACSLCMLGQLLLLLGLLTGLLLGLAAARVAALMVMAAEAGMELVVVAAGWLPSLELTLFRSLLYKLYRMGQKSATHCGEIELGCPTGRAPIFHQQFLHTSGREIR